MKMELFDHRGKFEEGNIHTLDCWNLGEHYKVERTTTLYEDGHKWQRISVWISNEDRNNYFPEILVRKNDFFRDDDFEFVIQTTAYGAKTPDEIQEVIAGYQEAIEAVKVLTDTFVK